MTDAIFTTPKAINEPIYSYAKGSPERKLLVAKIKELKSEVRDIPMVIGGKNIRTDKQYSIAPPYEIKHEIAKFHKGGTAHVQLAIDAALAAKPKWEALPWQDRAAIFLKAADLIAGPYRAEMNAATMLAQSKNAHQSEIDAVCEFIDFLRYNVGYMTQIYSEQPESSEGVWNRLDHRPLEGFVMAITPFNFTAIAGNLCAAPAMLGNVIVWKPAETQIYSAHVIMKVFREAGLPDGVINLIFVDGPSAGNIIFNHRDFAGLHFTGSTGVFRSLWATIGNNMAKYRTYPRIVGETGGKDFVFAHASANPREVATALIRGSFEFQGQKCSAASRAYISKTIWEDVKSIMLEDMATIKVGTPEDFKHYVNAVIDERSYLKIVDYIAKAKQDPEAEIIAGGSYSKEVGYFIDPTVIVTTDPKYRSMVEEIFGPVLTIFVFYDNDLEATLELVDTSSEYALTGAIFAKERNMINYLTKALRHAAGNFYINDKPTGAVVGQQPFGGGRGSGTNDKAGSILNLYRWISPRTIKETFVPATDYRYPFLDTEE